MAHDSRSVRPGDLFCCVPGASHDGHEFAVEAVRSGASALLGERPLGLTAPTVVVPSVRAAMPLLAAAMHGWPSRQLDLVGVTGTNGKTSVVHLLTWILGRAGRRTDAHGTLSGGRTTPEATDLQAMLDHWVSDGGVGFVLETGALAGLRRAVLLGSERRRAVFPTVTVRRNPQKSRYFLFKYRSRNRKN